jgi:predicted TIM-barrel fold metal-dependent hydrolase
MHIVGPFAAYPLRETRSLNPGEATLDAYRKVRAAMGMQRSVIVQPSVYAKDNACTLDAVDALRGTARAVVVVDPAIEESALAAMHARGARGVRVQKIVAGGASLDDIEELAARIRPFGWHLQFFMDAADIAELAPRLRRLPVDVVFDHMAHADRAVGMDAPGFQALLDLMQSGQTWVKLSNAFWTPDVQRVRRLIAANPDRVVWGSDWPHLGFQGEPPDDGCLVDAIGEWTQDASMVRRILVTNPERLYFSQDLRGSL